ncbi:MAG: 2-oxoacid:ferredoxin oxidoreductase subunit beta [Candidatus Woesearchaeota archaeon]
MLPTEDYLSGVENSWCPGCGDHMILQAMKLALKELKIPHEELVFVSGIGCGSKFPHYVNAYGMETLHGRILPNATGVKLANNRLTVIGIGGDGDAFGIGLNHFMHTMRRNLDITYIVQNNEIYALTKGQTSPVSPKGFKTKTTPSGVIEMPVIPLAYALIANATFVARTYAYNPKHMKEMIVAAIKHRGIAFLDIIQPCPSMNKGFDPKYIEKKIYDVKDKNHDKADWNAALKIAQEMEKFPIGIIYQEKPPKERPTYSDELFQMKDKPLVELDVENVDISETLEEYK